MAAAGAIVSSYLLVAALRGITPVCLTGACDRVAASPYARLFGAPLAGWGLSLYLVVGSLAGVAAALQDTRSALRLPFLGLVIFGAVFSAYLVWLQIGVLEAVCALCAVSAGLWTLLVAAGIALGRQT